MNFLSHYHFYKNDDPFYNTGLVLPDLVKAFCGEHLRPLNSYNRPFFTALADGSRKHLEADMRFHNSEYFHSTSAYIASLLDTDAQWPRKWFLNHLLTEIVTDRVLMDRHPQLCAEFYNQLELANPEQIMLFLKVSGILSYSSFKPGFERFISVRFIFEYLHNEKLIQALGRVYARAGIQHQWTDHDRALLLEHLPAIHSRIHLTVDNLEDALK